MKKSVMIGLAVGLLAALLLALWAWNQRNEAVYQASVTATAQSIAEEQRLEAEAARTTAVAEAQRRATEPPPSPTVTPTVTPSPTSTPMSQVVQIQPDSSQAEPGQPVTIRAEGLPLSVIAGQDVACLVLEGETCFTSSRGG
jgi:type VI protein secretion system component VasK